MLASSDFGGIDVHVLVYGSGGAACLPVPVLVSHVARVSAHHEVAVSRSPLVGIAPSIVGKLAEYCRVVDVCASTLVFQPMHIACGQCYTHRSPATLECPCPFSALYMLVQAWGSRCNIKDVLMILAQCRYYLLYLWSITRNAVAWPSQEQI